jgi:hypothetical protein
MMATPVPGDQLKDEQLKQLTSALETASDNVLMNCKLKDLIRFRRRCLEAYARADEHCQHKQSQKTGSVKGELRRLKNV